MFTVLIFSLYCLRVLGLQIVSVEPFDVNTRTHMHTHEKGLEVIILRIISIFFPRTFYSLVMGFHNIVS